LEKLPFTPVYEWIKTVRAVSTLFAFSFEVDLQTRRASFSRRSTHFFAAPPLFVALATSHSGPPPRRSRAIASSVSAGAARAVRKGAAVVLVEPVARERCVQAPVGARSRRASCMSTI
jgi:hypothetical protein